jgi:hypothetical protein
MKVTSCVGRNKNTLQSLRNPPKLFSIIPKCESIGVVLPPKLSRAVIARFVGKVRGLGLKVSA